MNTTILLLDDDKKMFNAINRLVRPLNAVVFSTGSEARALTICQDYQPQIVITDLNRKDMDVSEFLHQATKLSPHIRKIALTSFAELEPTVEAINKGRINRYFTKPWDGNELRSAISEELNEYHAQHEQHLSVEALGQKNEEMEEKADFTTKLLNGTTELLAASRHRASLNIMTTLLENRLPGAAEHAKKVAKTALTIAAQLNLSYEQREHISLAAELHQIGLLGLPDSMFNTSWDTMSASEQATYSSYPELGSKTLGNEQGSKPVAEIILHHCENNDGTGFPGNLVAQFIPLGARIVRVAMDYETRTREIGGSLALFEMAKDQRELYDPIVLNALISLKKKILPTKILNAKKETRA